MSTRPSPQDRLRSRPLRDLQAGSEELWAYRDAAAMLATFDFQELQPFQAEPSTEARSQLLADCDVTTSGPASTLWSLRTPIRKASLRRLFDRRALNDALHANPGRIITEPYGSSSVASTLTVIFLTLQCSRGCWRCSK